MGNYLEVPITEKESIDEESERMAYGASAMQGWRTDQEDAHNCILDFDENSSLFAVYDGHGGKDVSKYCSLHLPEFIKSVPDYKEGKISQALEHAFLDFDRTLKTPEVKAVLNKINGVGLVDPIDGNEIQMLHEEADIPIQKVIENYKKTAANLNHQSPLLKPKKNVPNVNGVSNESHNDSNSVFISDHTHVKHCENSSEVLNGVDNLETPCGLTDTVESEPVKCDSKEHIETDNVPGCSSSVNKSESSDSGALVKQAKFVRRLRQKEAVQLFDSSEDDEDGDSDAEYNESDQDDVEHDENDDGDEDDDEDTSKFDDEISDEETSDEEASDEEEECGVVEDSERDVLEPAEDSGCTACVALVRGSMLYVSNVGDSRCIVSRKGIAVEMSCDHKPEDEVETARIKAAGGQITPDGRVNGGLNLSRALGDHLYKKSDLPAEEQMISAQPDIQTLSITSDDEFMVTACDGIWNTMSSQEVVDFVKQRIHKANSLSKICEELFMHCLAPDSTGDGTGCDNMTSIIVKFKPAVTEGQTKKRKIEDSSESQETDTKRMRTD